MVIEAKTPSVILALFVQMFGHNAPIELLRKALASGRMHHAWVLCGPKGIGKRTLAEALAAVLLDPSATGAQLGDPPTLQSETLTLLKAGTHPDLHIIRRDMAAWSDNAQLRERKQTSIPIDLLRERLLGGRTSDGKVHDAPAYRRPVMGHAKVFIIDEAERLDLPGQNALLKTLEEPPPETTLLLITDRPERLLPTVHSRCQVLHMAPLNESAMTQWFNQHNVDTQLRPWLSEWACGAPGMAQAGLDRELRDWHDTLAPMLHQLDAGTWVPGAAEAMQSQIEAWTDAAVEENPKASREAAGRDGAEMLIRMLSTHVRANLFAAATSGDVHGVERHGGVADQLSVVERRLGASLNRKHVLEALVASWAAVD
jgi:DNA polymerase-3 subunit delta'